MPQFAIDPKSANSTPQQESSPTTALISRDETLGMVDECFVAMLQMDVSRQSDVEIVPSEDALQASVSVSGDHSIHISVVASKDLVKTIACVMFAAEPDDLPEEDCCDALGECANVIGGNAKGILDKSCSLSLPCVGQWDGQLPEGAQIVTVTLAGHPLTIAITEE